MLHFAFDDAEPHYHGDDDDDDRCEEDDDDDNERDDKFVALDDDDDDDDDDRPKSCCVYEKKQYYYHSDHLGSSSFISQRDGRVYEHIEYFPFGETWVEESRGSYDTPYRFTGKEFDSRTGLYYYGARYYDPRTSVWQSPDPILDKYMDGKPNAGVFNPHNLKLYSYTRNNPVNLVDDDGNAFFVPIVIFLIKELGSEAVEQATGVPMPTVKNAVKFSLKTAAKQARKSTVKQTVKKFDVGEYKQLKGKLDNHDAHHVGQKALMKKFVKNYDEDTAPSILVPKVGHTAKKKGVGIVSRSSKLNITNPNTKSMARSVVARDVKEMKRVYPEVSNKQLQKLIEMNKQKYPELKK